MNHQVPIQFEAEVEERLGQLPTATTIGERRLAFYFAATHWSGQHHIFENGPLLGGVTRALGMGMMLNKNRSPRALLHTYDWFSLNQPLDVPDESFPYLIEQGLLTEEQLMNAVEDQTFLPVFNAIHEKGDYGPLIRPHLGYLPGHRGEQAPDGVKPFAIPVPRKFSLAFIDGCKSWYGTKHWFLEMLSHFEEGADIMFQDFSHYTCFWIPMLVALFREHFELICWVDFTYTWRLKTLPSPEEVERLYPDEPTDLTRETYDEKLGGLYAEFVAMGDQREILLLQMQQAAAYSYIGLKDESREILDGLLRQSAWIPLRPYLKQARISPTYTPEERIEL